MSSNLPAQNYNTLKQDITHLLDEGKFRAQRALEKELVVTYHAVGKQLQNHLETQGNQSIYGAQLIERLSQDVGIGSRQLYDCLRFYRQFPKLPTSTELVWSHYRLLLTLPDAETRTTYLHTCAQERWSVRELQAQIQAPKKPVQTITPSPKDHLPPLRGRLFTYKQHESPSGPRLDLGFRIYRTWPTEISKAWTTVHTTKTPTGFAMEPTQDRRDTFYTFRAILRSVIDGDTLWLDIDCGFDTWTDQKVRLRGIDTPELDTPEGRRAKRFVEAALRNAPVLAVTTTKPDKYDRYLADIFYLADETDPQTVLDQGHFLNRTLIDAGLAKRV